VSVITLFIIIWRGVNRRFQAKRANIRNCIFSILVIDSIQILHDDKDHQYSSWISQYAFDVSKMARVLHFAKKIDKSKYLSNILTNRHEI